MRSNRWLLLTCLLPLAACSSTPSSADTAPTTPKPEVAGLGSHCHGDTLTALSGQMASQEVIDRAVRDAGARTLRVVKPGMAVTMDYREDRVTVRVDEQNKIISASCG
ncbi:hypothetical protein H9654_03595 [Stenotrophomonas sp. Sa5BUN4]|jgi:hypothetical protein|uniref:Peptidase inhibitor I78 family protein n=1 Tax=Stenotrophomonas lacuserhaii TaxID=2760084 RepID=A0A8X8FTQ4_9GAMM|nr:MULTISPECIES: I78 family peptidase inhibitor [Stenotrophomonas]MBD7953283.1 hypothetical protein [Stenotrophomonas pennii]MBD8644784.1 hypothetical protein [Stenotrophomonas sp. CFBP 13724]MDX3931968.1 I78 family peptidase inhibitor [Stenotrophomonas sp.]MDY1034768.1 I78 family peptidase inhibitor [Stenotrophomonas sp. CFBP8980]PKH71034.1 hypothetical protein CXF90_11520 [Stenotrophomonas sp. Betaine-02u-23]